ncbi:MAG: GNAT family N-acetyltransferase [Acidobacteriota bacterium]|nr:GNAT family N-acetyltransferase [Pyrinomonadaceae bacterium]MDW8303550.1 GNAT family N-acetyltransferase [Acidobacteriota bacterium]
MKADKAYPKTVKIAEKTITLRPLLEEDGKAILDFARSLPEEDLLFLSFDITDENVVKQWIKYVKSGLWHTIIAENDNKIVGHATLLRTEQIWTRHLGELIILVAPELRGHGLGSKLAFEIFKKAEELKLMKLVARMAATQKSAIAVFERLGFRAEALLSDYVIDRKGQTHDLLAMSYDVRGFTQNL